MSHPRVIPAAARASMLAWWVFPWVSVNPAGVWAGGSWRARTRKLAIWARVTERSGQYRGGSAAQPRVIWRSGELLGVADPPLAVGDVGEAGVPHSWGVAAEDADEPDGHGRSFDGLVGTEQPFAAFGIDEQTVGG